MEISLPDHERRQWIEAYADREGELLDRIAHLEADRDASQEIARLALEKLHTLTRQNDEMRRRRRDR